MLDPACALLPGGSQRLGMERLGRLRPGDVLFFGAEITPLELTTFGVIMLAVYLHTVLARNYAPPPPPPPATPEV